MAARSKFEAVGIDGILKNSWPQKILVGNFKNQITEFISLSDFLILYTSTKVFLLMK